MAAKKTQAKKTKKSKAPSATKAPRRSIDTETEPISDAQHALALAAKQTRSLETVAETLMKINDGAARTFPSMAEDVESIADYLHDTSAFVPFIALSLGQIARAYTKLAAIEPAVGFEKSMSTVERIVDSRARLDEVAHSSIELLEKLSSQGRAVRAAVEASDEITATLSRFESALRQFAAGDDTEMRRLHSDLSERLARGAAPGAQANGVQANGAQSSAHSMNAPTA